MNVKYDKILSVTREDDVDEDLIVNKLIMDNNDNFVLDDDDKFVTKN